MLFSTHDLDGNCQRGTSMHYTKSVCVCVWTGVGTLDISFEERKFNEYYNEGC